MSGNDRVRILCNYVLFAFQVRWGDKKDGYGEHYWEYNHGPKDYKAPVYNVKSLDSTA